MATHLKPLRLHGPPVAFPGDDEGNKLPIPWAEDLSDEEPFSGSMSYSDQIAFTMRIWVNWAERQEAFRYILGFHYRETGANGGTHLRRYPEWRCPHFGHLRASKIAEFKPFYYQDHEPFDDQEEGSLSNWDRLRLTVAFAVPRYNVVPDDNEYAVGDESARYVQRREEDYLESVTYPGKFYLADGPGTGTEYEGRTGLQVSRTALFYTWHKVPKEIIYNSDGVATNMDACKGRVNSTTFLGYPPQTLLCETPKIEEEPAPFWAVENGNGFDAYESPVVLKVGITLKHFNPEPWDTTRRGWNLVPMKGSTKWVLATHDGGTGAGSRRLYEAVDFNTYLFKAV